MFKLEIELPQNRTSEKKISIVVKIKVMIPAIKAVIISDTLFQVTEGCLSKHV